MLTESKKDGMTDMLKTVYTLKLPFTGDIMRNLYSFFMLSGGLLNIYKKVLSKYLQWDSNTDLLSLFSL